MKKGLDAPNKEKGRPRIFSVVMRDHKTKEQSKKRRGETCGPRGFAERLRPLEISPNER